MLGFLHNFFIFVKNSTMKKPLLFIFLSVVFITGKIFAQDPPQMKKGFVMTKDFINPYTVQDKIYKSKSSKVVTFHTFDVLHYKLELNFHDNYSSPYLHSYNGIETITVLADSLLSCIKLNAIDSFLTVDSVKLAGTSFIHQNDTLTVLLDSTYNPGDTIDVKIYYRHNDVIDYAFYTGNGFVYTDCSPEKARSWFPCWDKTFDKATFEVFVDAEKDVELCSNGALVDSLTTNDTLRYHWKSANPVATFIMAILSNQNYNVSEIYWKKPSNNNDSIPVIFYYNNGEDISPLKDVMLEMTDYFSSIYGEYPFQKIAWATLDSQFPWAGMENQTIISLYAKGWADKTTTTHEFAHHWFGDLITPATWSDIFLKEGFAQYSVFLWNEHLGGESGYNTAMNNVLGDYFYFNPVPAWPISDSSWATTTPPSTILFDYGITYCKSPFVLHMLRNIVGDSIFFAIIKDYATDPNLMFKAATINDFCNKVSAHYSADLSWFFNEWLKQPNHPNYSNHYNVEDSSGTWKVQITTEQIQTNAPFFKMPLEWEIDFSDFTDTIVHVMNDQNNQTYTYYFSKEPISIIFDPKSKVLPKVEAYPDYCTGTTVLTALSDTITDGSGITNYDNNSNCKWDIVPTDAATVTLHFNRFNLEPVNDKVRILDIDNPSVPLGIYSGTTIPPDITSPSGKMRIIFTSNTSITASGFEATYFVPNVGIENYIMTENIKVFPNPVNNDLYFSFDGMDISKVNVEIFEPSGKSIIATKPDNMQFKINVSGLNEGIYFYKIVFEGEVVKNGNFVIIRN